MTENFKISGSAMRGARRLLKKAFASVTVMVIPHDHVRTLNLKVPIVFLVTTILLALVGGSYLVGMTVKSIKYRAENLEMAATVKKYSDEFSEWNSTVETLKLAGNDFRKLFELGSREEVLEEAVDMDFTGSPDLPDLIEELQRTRQEVKEIYEYLQVQKDVFVSTPRGYPVSGYRLTSTYGIRPDPMDGKRKFHSGVDLACNQGTPIQATADGIVSHSGWTTDSGYVVVLEHGLGFSTIYAHNKSNNVKIGDKVLRGDVIAVVGSTGRTTGPHVHYEVLKDGKTVNPAPYLSGKGT
ncbi:MAG: M23 family metallopeptidase [Acidobacteria bacterium]|nr:M23 family metallopeptidase [Acidobacteriota bacterium]